MLDMRKRNVGRYVGECGTNKDYKSKTSLSTNTASFGILPCGDMQEKFLIYNNNLY